MRIRQISSIISSVHIYASQHRVERPSRLWGYLEIQTALQRQYTAVTVWIKQSRHASSAFVSNFLHFPWCPLRDGSPSAVCLICHMSSVRYLPIPKVPEVLRNSFYLVLTSNHASYKFSTYVTKLLKWLCLENMSFWVNEKLYLSHLGHKEMSGWMEDIQSSLNYRRSLGFTSRIPSAIRFRHQMHFG